MKRFKSLHGGLWLMSDAETEEAVSDAIYRIGWHNDINDEDESFLRRHLADARHEEKEHFWQVVLSFSTGRKVMKQWHAMVEKGVGLKTIEERSESQVWLLMEACHDYCDLIDMDWRKIADWYQPASKPSPGLSGKTLYDALASKVQMRNKGSNKQADNSD